MDVSESSLLLNSLSFEAFYYCYLLQQALQKVGAEILSFNCIGKVYVAGNFIDSGNLRDFYSKNSTSELVYYDVPLHGQLEKN